MKKNAWVAAILNFFLMGAGTMYVGKRPLVGFLILLGGAGARFVEMKTSPTFDHSIPALWPYLVGGLGVLQVALAIDGWREAKAVSGA